MTIPDVTTLAHLYALDRAIRLEPRPDRRLEMAIRAQAEAARIGLTRNVLVSYEAIVTALGILGRWEEARQASADWRRLAWRSGTLEDVLWSYCNRADFAWHHGLVADYQPALSRAAGRESEVQRLLGRGPAGPG